MQTVVQKIRDHIPDIQDLSNNKIYSVDQMKPLSTKAVFLKSLNLGSNKPGQITSLDRLQGLKLEELDSIGTLFVIVSVNRALI